MQEGPRRAPGAPAFCVSLIFFRRACFLRRTLSVCSRSRSCFEAQPLSSSPRRALFHFLLSLTRPLWPPGCPKLSAARDWAIYDSSDCPVLGEGDRSGPTTRGRVVDLCLCGRVE